MNAQWIDAAAQDDLWDDSGTSVVLNGLEIALFRVGDAAYATDNLCSHGQARLCDGFVEGHEIECPLHQGRFDLRTGQASAEPAVEAVKTYPVRIEGGRVYVWLE
ncbi:MAG: non-heme iron oxygenase ferredoxin subunit [Burkholderiales bacterium]|jgi:naphthalene 1,2-dioxygenase system ferredoxin subunit|nr:non-heme iron oxygenase ferredoxin subunit [Burkholderiales bacterium]